MSFIQVNLFKSINQSRDIFDKFIYRTDDSTSDILVSGYFSESRFASDWVGGVIEADCSDGYIIGKIQDGGTITDLIDATTVDRIDSDREVVMRGTDTTDQLPVGTDNPLQVTFGAAQNTASDPVNLDASGNIFINVADNYHFRLSSQYGRSGSGGTAWLWQRVLVNGSQAGVSVLAKLNNAGSDFPYQAELTADLPAGVTVTVELWRGSEGVDDGGYITETPVLSGANPGFSADLIVSRYVLRNL